MEGQSILIYGPAETGKSTFVKRIKGIECNEIPKNEVTPNQFPTIYVSNIEPDYNTTVPYTMVLEFNKNGEVIFIKGFEHILADSN